MTRILLAGIAAVLYVMLRDEKRNRAQLSAALEAARRELEEEICWQQFESSQWPTPAKNWRMN